MMMFFFIFVIVLVSRSIVLLFFSFLILCSIGNDKMAMEADGWLLKIHLLMEAEKIIMLIRHTRTSCTLFVRGYKKNRFMSRFESEHGTP
jgi:hypothetical protein